MSDAKINDDFVLLTVLAFDDDSLGINLIHRGTKESCVKGAELIDAISYNGTKRVVESCVRWMPYAVYQDALAGNVGPDDGGAKGTAVIP